MDHRSWQGYDRPEVLRDGDKPDWCGGVDLDQNSLVNFRDFALFDGCCIEVVGD
ncbi:MAG: hypothetical protein ACYTEQ_24330 [Planctomycetota bacterium]